MTSDQKEGERLNVQFFRESSNDSSWKDIKYDMSGYMNNVKRFNDDSHSYELDGKFFMIKDANDGMNYTGD